MYRAVLLCSTFIMLYKVVLTFKSVDATLVCVNSNESYRAMHSLVLFIMLYKVVVALTSVENTLVCDHLKENTFI